MVTTVEGQEVLNSLISSVNKRLKPYHMRSALIFAPVLDPKFKKMGSDADSAIQHLQKQYYLLIASTQENVTTTQSSTSASTSSLASTSSSVFPTASSNGKLKMTLPLPKRFIVGVMIFMIGVILYMMRVNLSINIIAMTSHTTGNKTLADYGPRYDWSQNDQAILLGAYFYGYMVLSFPAGMIAERYGGKAVVGYTCLVAVFLTALTPLVVSFGVWEVFVLRLAIGCLGGVVFPSCQFLISKWAPPTEKGKFLSALMGGSLGTVITWPMSGIIIERMGWYWAFYIVAVFSFIVILVWFMVIFDSPAEHTTITPEERDFIETSLGGSVSKRKKSLPYRQLFSSVPFWSLLLLHYGDMWGLFFTIIFTPKYMSEVLNFKLSSAGFSSSLPHILRLLCAFGFGAIGDNIRRKELMSVTNIRKVFCMFSHVIPGILILILGFFGREPYFCVALISLSLGINGAATVTNLANPQDLAPNYAGSIFGVINSIGTSSGIFFPFVVAFFTRDNNSFNEWQNIFLISGIMYIVPTIIFWCLGSGEVQPWNDIDKD